jgi:hypothetical protein
VPSLAKQLIGGLGPAAAFMGLIGAALALWPPWRRSTGLLLSWSLIPLVLYLLFHAGVDNFQVAEVALAILAGGALASWPRAASVMAVIVFALSVLAQWLPVPAKETPFGQLWGRTAGPAGLSSQPSFRNHYRVWTSWGGDDVAALLEATCPDRSQVCNIAVDQGLFLPYGEEAGSFELFLIGADHVRPLALADRHGPIFDGEPVVALAHWQCPRHDRDWRIRHPESEARLLEIIDEQDLRPWWTFEVERRCHYVWYTPGGAPPDPSGVTRPDPSGVTRPYTPGGALSDPSGGALPDPSGVTQPDPSGVTRPYTPGGALSDPSGVTQPDPSGVTRPYTPGGALSDPSGVTRPDPSGEVPPSTSRPPADGSVRLPADGPPGDRTSRSNR